MEKAKIITIMGTRPEIIKLSPIILKLDQYFNHLIIHTGQHYSPEMSEIFFEDLNLPKPDYNVHVGSGNQGFQIGNMIIKLEEILLKEKPSAVIVHGDTNSTLAGALVARKLNIKLIHIESGGRSHNRNMPEEINRIIVDHISDILFCYDNESEQNLKDENIINNTNQLVFKIQNTSFEACKNALSRTITSRVMDKLNIKENEIFIVVTLHRAENTNSKERLGEIISALNELANKYKLVFFLHPRTLKLIKEYKISLDQKIILSPPLGYLDFIKILSCSYFILSDSGGIQDEAITLKKPLFILRNEIEQNWLIEKEKAVLLGTKKEEILHKLEKGTLSENFNKMIQKNIDIDYKVSDKIIQIISDHILD